MPYPRELNANLSKMIHVHTNEEGENIIGDLLICRSEDHYVVATIHSGSQYWGARGEIKIWNIDDGEKMVLWYLLQTDFLYSFFCEVSCQGKTTSFGYDYKNERPGCVRRLLGCIMYYLRKLPILPETLTEPQTLKDEDLHSLVAYNEYCVFTDLNSMANYLIGE